MFNMGHTDWYRGLKQVKQWPFVCPDPGCYIYTPGVKQGWKVFIVVEDDPWPECVGCDLPGFHKPRL